MTQRRAIRVVATSARLVAGAVIAVGCVAGVVAAVALPWPTVANEPAELSVRPSAGDTTLVCNGPFRAIGRDTMNAQQMSPAGRPAVTVDSNGPREASDIAISDLTGDAPAPQRFVGSAEQGGSSLVAAAESVTIAADDLAGLAAGACRAPSTESWLVGGTVETGTSDLIILTNPGDVASTVTLTVYGLEPTSTTTVVPAGTQLAVPLASVAAGLQQPVVRVTAEGAPVRAVLQSSLIRTLDPSGIALQDTAGAPSANLTFAGVQVREPSDDTPVTVLRLMATDQATNAAVTVRAGGEVVQEVSVPLDAQVPAELGLEGLERGVYSIEVEAESAVVGATWQTNRIGAGSDFTWMTPAPEIAEQVMIAVPRGPGARIHLVNTQDADANVTLTPTAGGEERTVTVPAGGSELVEARADTTYTLTTDAPLHAAVVLAGTDALAGWPIWPSAAAQQPIAVYP
ncbi:DUF5719 family protein [Microbacterium sp.]|uniref:DUF5719 family protein n=1 Tax=Microbacterium sp. TaxID=51671 RepID=UPI00260FD756|nr:DUF5719 family protein [Microbacterium sp.]